jgi:hypothetical protein
VLRLRSSSTHWSRRRPTREHCDDLATLLVSATLCIAAASVFVVVFATAA